MRFRFSLRLAATVLVSFSMVNASRAQTTNFRVLHSFAGGSDGSYPTTTLVLAGTGRLYGTTYQGGSSSGCASNGCGTAFELLEKNGHWVKRVLLDFSTPNNFFPDPVGSLVADAKGNVYGTDAYTGDPTCNCGTVFQLTMTGGVWSQNILHNFLGGTSDGTYPGSGLVQDSAGNLYGATPTGGTYNNGTVFELTPNADGTWAYAIIHSFVANGFDGISPNGRLTIDKFGNVYGTTPSGGLYGDGAVFRITPSDGTWTETILYNFTLDFGDGQLPEGVVPGADGNLYGSTVFGGEYQLGTIYKLTPSVGYWNRTVLHTFTGGNDGAYPYGGLIIDKTGTLYGTGSFGGMHGYGTVFKVSEGAQGRWKLMTLHSFAGTDGSYPELGVIADPSGNLFGVTNSGGQSQWGVAFEVVP